MKRLLRNIIISIAVIEALKYINPGFRYDGGYKTLILSGFVMFMLDTLVEPILSIIFLPINFLTKGLFGWILCVGLFWALTYFVPSIHISPWTFSGITIPVFNYTTITLPVVSLVYWQNLCLLAIMYNIITGFFKWICSDA